MKPERTSDGIVYKGYRIIDGGDRIVLPQKAADDYKAICNLSHALDPQFELLRRWKAILVEDLNIPSLWHMYGHVIQNGAERVLIRR